MKIETLNDLFLHELQEAYAAERCAVDTIPRLTATAAAGVTVPAADQYMIQTRKRLKRLEDILALAAQQPKAAASPTIEGVAHEAERLMGTVEDRVTRVAALFAVLERMKHDLLTRYVTLASWAIALGKAGEARLLLTTIDEEREATIFPQADARAARDKVEVRTVGMGDRLTALLDRKG